MDAHPVYAPPPVIEPGHTFGTGHGEIAAIVLTRRHPTAGSSASSVGFMLTMMLLMAITWLLLKGHRHLGRQHPHRLGLRDHQLRLVDRYRPRGDADFGDPAAAQTGLAHVHQPLRGSDDAFCGRLRRHLPAHSHRASVARRVLASAVSKHDGDLAAVPQPAHLGRLRCLDLLDGVADVLVCGPRSRSRDAADRAKSLPIRRLFGMLALGWRGSARHWERYEAAYLLLAGLSTPLVLSVHTVVSFDFAIGIIPGWHATIFPPYFVAGAIYAGFAMVLTLAIPLRVLYGLEDFLTMRHLENMGKVMLVTGLIVGYGYVFEAFFGFYSANQYESYMIVNRMTGPYWPFYWMLIVCNIVAPQFLWNKRIRTTPIWLFVISQFVNVGMWLERFEIVVTSLHRDFLPSSWGWYWPTKWDIMTFFGTIGLFITLFFLFIRVLPMISIFEMRTIVPGAKVKGAKAH
jgi:molybdopterin-containing oxidoreductase family membrane subunit